MASRESRIGPYTILRLIRQGGQGRVYLGYDRRLCRQVAIKVHTLPRGRAQRREALAEARKVAGLSDGRVVQIYDLIEARGYLAIVMEYVPGCDLEEILSQATLSVPAVIRVGIDLAAAIAAAAQDRVVHGDIKAGNVLVTREGRVKLTDFGVARQAGVGGPAAGSLQSAAPEQLRGEGADLRSDLFSLGCLLYRLLAGQHPFSRGRQTALAGRGECKPPSLDGLQPGGDPIPRELLELVDDLLRQDPGKRPQDTHRVRSELRCAARAFPLSRADSLREEARPWFRLESAADIPLHIPGDLLRRGRSRLVRRGLELWMAQFRRQRLTTQMAILLAIPLCALAAYEILSAHSPPRVHFAEPEISLSTTARPGWNPGSHWLMQTVLDAVEERTGPLQASGSVASSSYFAQLAGRSAQTVVSTSLRCSEVLCVFLITRRDGEEFRYRQALIPPNLPRRDWESLVAQGSAALFP